MIQNITLLLQIDDGDDAPGDPEVDVQMVKAIDSSSQAARHVHRIDIGHRVVFATSRKSLVHLDCQIASTQDEWPEEAILVPDQIQFDQTWHPDVVQM